MFQMYLFVGKSSCEVFVHFSQAFDRDIRCFAIDDSREGGSRTVLLVAGSTGSNVHLRGMCDSGIKGPTLLNDEND